MKFLSSTFFLLVTSCDKNLHSKPFKQKLSAMAQYKVSATDSKTFPLTLDNTNMGVLIYKKWYSLDAEIHLADGSQFYLQSPGFWSNKIELKDANQTTLLDFNLRWSGIIINTFFDDYKDKLLLKHHGLLNYKYTLLNEAKEELLFVEADFRWKRFKFDFTFNTTPLFDGLMHKELILLNAAHCVNYYMTMIAAASA